MELLSHTVGLLSQLMGFFWEKSSQPIGTGVSDVFYRFAIKKLSAGKSFLKTGRFPADSVLSE
jgi:hypothetical protein